MTQSGLENIKQLVKEIKAEACPQTPTKSRHPFSRLEAIKAKAESILNILKSPQ